MLMGKFVDTVDHNIVGFEVLFVAPLAASTQAKFDASSVQKLAKFNGGVGKYSQLKKGYAALAPPGAPFDEKALKVVISQAAPDTPEADIQALVELQSLIAAVPELEDSESAREQHVSAQVEVVSKTFAELFRTMINQTRVAVGMALLSIVAYVLALSMLLNDTKSYTIVFLELVGAFAALMFLVMIQLNSNTQGALTLEKEKLGQEAGPKGAASAAVYSAGISLGAGLIAALLGAFSVKTAKKESPSSYDAKMEMIE